VKNRCTTIPISIRMNNIPKEPELVNKKTANKLTTADE
jgi:hypothetical protein